MPKKLQHKQYLGDGVYVGHDGYQIWLQTENGIEVTNEIALEPEVVEAFQRYLERMRILQRGGQ